jgi:hypothetical protein
MSTFISFHIKSDNRVHIAKLLKELSHVDEMTCGTYPTALDDNILLSDQADPTFMAVGDTHNGWTSVQLNSFKKLHNWAEKISKELDTIFIHIIGQTASDVYYFLMYDKGFLRREIEIYYGDLENTTDKGEKFSFEKPCLIPQSDDDYKNIFDRETLEQYCQEFGFDLFFEDEFDSYYILRSKRLGKTIREYAASYSNPKPWWRFW